MSTVPTNQATNQTQATKASSAVSSLFDRLNKGKDADAFASMLSGLKKGMFEGGDRARLGRLQRMQEKFDPDSTLLAQSDKERKQKLDEEEEDKKAREKKELERELRNQELDRKEQEQADLTKMALNMAGSAQSSSPFARLVSALDSSGTSAGSSSSTSSLSLGTSVGSGAGAGAGTGNGAGAGAGTGAVGGSTVGHASNVNGYAVADASSSEAQAASLMSAVSDDSAHIEQDLNALNQKNLSAVPQSQPESMAERLSNMNNADLRQSLDNLAKAGSVSKLNLQMANPQTAAAEANNAAAIANMPTSGNKLAGLGGSASPSAAPSSATANPGAQASSHVSTESLIKFRQSQQAAEGAPEIKSSQEFLEQTAAKLAQNGSNARGATGVGSGAAGSAGAGAAGSGVSLASASVGGAVESSLGYGTSADSVLTTESALQAGSSSAGVANGSAASSRATHLGANHLGSTVRGTANAQAGRINALNSIDAFNSTGATKTLGLNSLSGTNGLSSSGLSSTLNSGLSSNGLGESGSALLASVARNQAAQLQSSLSATLSAQNQEQALGLAFGLNNESLALSGNTNAAMQQALASLKQGMGLQPQYVQGYDPRNYMSGDSLAWGTVNAGNAGAANAGDSSDSGLNYGEDSADSTAASAAAAASAQAAQNFAQSVANLSNPTATTLASSSMSLSSSASENAKELHDKVMEMSARNLKQLSVDLSPNNLGKMRIEITLDKANDALSVSLSSANPQTRKALEQALPELKNALANQNIQVDEQVYELSDATDFTAQTQGENNANAGQYAGRNAVRNADTAQEFFAQRHVTQTRIQSGSKTSGIVFAKTKSHEVRADNLTALQASAQLSETASGSTESGLSLRA